MILEIKYVFTNPVLCFLFCLPLLTGYWCTFGFHCASEKWSCHQNPQRTRLGVHLGAFSVLVTLSVWTVWWKNSAFSFLCREKPNFSFCFSSLGVSFMAHTETLLTLLATTYVESQFLVRSPLCHQLNALSNLILALPTKRHIRLHELMVHSYKMPLPFQMPITGPDSHPCIRLTGYRSEVLTSSSGLINLPELHAELRKRVCAY